MTGLLEHLLESEIIVDGVVAQDETQVLGLWSLRETLPEAAGKLGKVYKYDLSMPVKDMYSLVEEARVRFEAQGLIADGSIKTTIGYGHVGDGEHIQSCPPQRAGTDVIFFPFCLRLGNLHINIVANRWDAEIEKVIEPWIYEATGTFCRSPVVFRRSLSFSLLNRLLFSAARNGSISAEHGLGVMKAPYLAYSKSEESIDVMRGIRTLFDPEGILSPYKYLPTKA